VSLETELNIVENELYSYYITKDNSISLKFDQRRQSYRELEFIAYSAKMSAFRIYISDKNNPSSSNSMTIIPTWIGGYYASVTKHSPHFCFNCTYYILLESENDLAEVFFTIKYEDSVSKVNPHEPIFSALKPFRRHCYSINVEEKYADDELIIQTMLFSGSTKLLINPWEMPKNHTSFKFSKDINSEDVTIIQEKDSLNGKNNTGLIYICLRSYDYTSYMLKIYFSSQTENLQKFNFLYTGVSVNGYLPKETVTRYRATEFTKDADIFFKLKVYSGNPKFYGYVCNEAKLCFFSKEVISNLSKHLKN